MYSTATTGYWRLRSEYHWIVHQIGRLIPHDRLWFRRFLAPGIPHREATCKPRIIERPAFPLRQPIQDRAYKRRRWLESLKH